MRPKTVEAWFSLATLLIGCAMVALSFCAGFYAASGQLPLGGTGHSGLSPEEIAVEAPAEIPAAAYPGDFDVD